MKDRIDLDDDGNLDDVVIDTARFVHIERMDDAHLWMSIERSDGTYVVCRFYSKRGAAVLWSLEEE